MNGIYYRHWSGLRPWPLRWRWHCTALALRWLWHCGGHWIAFWISVGDCIAFWFRVGVWTTVWIALCNRRLELYRIMGCHWHWCSLWIVCVCVCVSLSLSLPMLGYATIDRSNDILLFSFFFKVYILAIVTGSINAMDPGRGCRLFWDCRGIVSEGDAGRLCQGVLDSSSGWLFERCGNGLALERRQWHYIVNVRSVWGPCVCFGWISS